MGETCEECGRPHPDGCVVETAPLAAILQDFVTDWRRRRPNTRGQYSGEERNATDVQPVSAYDVLAFETGLPETAIRRIRNPRKHPMTELRVADRLVASIGASPLLFQKGEALEPQPNPKAPPERQRECCGRTSLTGTGQLSRRSL